MGQLTKKLNIDPCPNCGSVNYELSPDDKFNAHPFHAKCAECGFNYKVYYIPPSASISAMWAQSIDDDVFSLFARNI